MRDELVFVVDEAVATPARPIGLADAGLREVQHLQEWVLAHPEILGPGVKIVTAELAEWQSGSGSPDQERLDVLGLDRSAKLVVAELKRGTAPTPTTMQSVGYAARASRFTPELLAEKHAQFLSRRGQTTTNEVALERLALHAEYELTPDRLASPRIVLVASEFPEALTATVVWLTEQGLEITLRQFQAYQTATQILITVSQTYPVPDVEEFTIGPRRRAAEGDASREYPEVPWTPEEVERLRDLTQNPMVHTMLDLCQADPGSKVSFSDLTVAADRSVGQARGDLAGLTMMVKRHFDRQNWPVLVEFNESGQAHYRMAPELAQSLSDREGGSHAEGPSSSPA